MASKDFTKQREPIEFTVDPDTFRAPPAIPAGVMLDATAKMDGLEEATLNEQIGAYLFVLEMCLEPESYAVLQQRMHDRSNPIDITQLTDITMWLFEQYGLRPTTPSEDSSDGPSGQASGTTSTDVQPSVELISASSSSIAS